MAGDDGGAVNYDVNFRVLRQDDNYPITGMEILRRLVEMMGHNMRKGLVNC